MRCGVYLFVNSVNGKVYVGSAINLKRRMNRHRWELNTGRHSNEHLLRAWRDYGSEAFQFEVVEYCEPECRLDREQWWIVLLDSLNGEKGYNKITARPGGGMKGRHCSPETRAKLAAAARAYDEKTGHLARLATANRGRTWSESQKEKLRGRVPPMKGKTHTPESRAKMAAAARGRPSSNKGKSPSAETREKLRQANLGKRYSEETRAKVSAAGKGRPGPWKGKKKPLTEETKAKISATKRRRWAEKQAEITDGIECCGNLGN